MMDPLQEVSVFNGLGFSTSAMGSIPFHSISVSLPSVLSPAAVFGRLQQFQRKSWLKFNSFWNS